ncbi:MAG: Nif3-like dinuclear metal center hexameric protein [Chlamydiales bacterium]
MNRKQFIEYLDSYLNTPLIKDFCPNGLQIEGKEGIEKAATAVSANKETIEKAVEAKVDALIVHHGLFWSRDPYPIVGTKREKIHLLLEHGISLLAYHLPLDAHQLVGNNWKAANDLGWKECQPFGILNDVSLGVKGIFSPIPIEQFISELENYYQHGATAALGGKKIIQSAALVSGGAYKEVNRAAEEGVDCFITGHFDEPAWNIAHEEKIHFLALGHSATERVGPKALAHHIQSQLEIPCAFIDVPNPF